MKYKVFIDGQEGTTGLRILERLKNRSDIELLSIDSDLRKDKDERQKLINLSDLTILCLPDVASREAVTLVTNPNTKIIDASTAFRTSSDWAYGLPELSKKHLDNIKTSKRVCVPGCHASGFVSLVYPLIQNNIIEKSDIISCVSVTGYSGGGKKMIAEYEDDSRNIELSSPRQYGLTQMHKHLPEMKTICGLENEPIFIPIVGDHYCGMIVNITLHQKNMKTKKTIEEMKNFYRSYYSNQKFIKYIEKNDSFLACNTLEGKDFMEIFVFGNDERMTLTARLDNLGKGASGAAVQCMNIMLGLDPTIGLVL